MNMVSQSELERRLEIDAALLLNMSNKHRLRILTMLREGEAVIKSIAYGLGLSESAVSQHLAKLRKGKLVETQKRAGHAIYYSCNSPAALRLLDTLEDIFKPASKQA